MYAGLMLIFALKITIEINFASEVKNPDEWLFKVPNRLVLRIYLRMLCRGSFSLLEVIGAKPILVYKQ